MNPHPNANFQKLSCTALLALIIYIPQVLGIRFQVFRYQAKYAVTDDRRRYSHCFRVAVARYELLYTCFDRVHIMTIPGSIQPGDVIISRKLANISNDQNQTL